MNIIADLHTHTIASGHAYSTLTENISVAKEKDIQFLGVSDHAPALDDAPKETYFKNLKVVRKNWDNLNILCGVELNILNGHGDVDLPEEVLDGLDYAMASLHYPIFPKERISLCTDAAIASMSNPSVFILGHPDDDLMQLDYKAVVSAARNHHVALEINNSSLCPGSFRTGASDNYCKMLKLVRSMDVPVIVSSDSHIFHDVGNFSRALALLRENKFPEELVVNSSPKRFLDFFECRKDTALSTGVKKLLCTG